jgi:inosose dehydratase
MAGIERLKESPMNVLLGTAPDSWGVWFPEDEKQVPWQRYLDEVAACGHGWTELGPLGYLPTDQKRLKAELDARGLRLSGAAIGGDLALTPNLPKLAKQLLAAARLLAPFEEAEYLVLLPDCYTDLQSGEQVAPKELGAAEWQRLIDTTHNLGRLAREYALHLVFHPHADSQVEREDQIERFLRDTDPDLVNLCLDTGHHAYCGGDAVGFFKQHHQRIPYLHLKNVDRTILSQVRAASTSFAEAVARGVMCEPPHGMIDFIALRDALQQSNYHGFAIVEQDMYPVLADKPLPIAKRTREYLMLTGWCQPPSVPP